MRCALTPKAHPDVLPDIACAFTAKFSPIPWRTVRCANVRVPIAFPNIAVLVDNRPVIHGHFTGPAMRIGIVDTRKNLPGSLDIEIAALLDLVGASSGYAGVTVNNKQAAAPFITARQTMLWLRMRRRKGKRNCKGSRYSSYDHLVIRCEAARLENDRTLLDLPRAHVETVPRQGPLEDHTIYPPRLLRGGSMDRLNALVRS